MKKPTPAISRASAGKLRAKAEAGGKTLAQLAGEDSDTSRAGKLKKFTRTPPGMKKR